MATKKTKKATSRRKVARKKEKPLPYCVKVSYNLAANKGYMDDTFVSAIGRACDGSGVYLPTHTRDLHYYFATAARAIGCQRCFTDLCLDSIRGPWSVTIRRS